jgi:multidrug resistance protein, MATE family
MTMTTHALGAAGHERHSPLAERIRDHLAEARTLGRLAAPMVAAGALNMGLSLTDTAMMGWLDHRALAAGVVVSDAYSILFYFASAMVGAVAPLAAQALGAGDDRRAGKIVGQGLWLLMPLALAGAFLIANSISFMAMLGVSLPLRQDAEDYALMMGGAFIFMLVFSWGRSALSAMGRQRVPMYVMAAVLPLNALGNYLLMYGAWGLPEMGLAGAGASSLIVAAVAASSVAVYMNMPSMRRFAIFGELSRIEFPLVLRLAPMGLMMALTTVAETGVYLSSSIVLGVIAADALAAHAIVFRMLGLGYVIVVGCGQAVMVRVATAFGAGDSEGLRRARGTAHAAAILAALMALAIFGMARLALGEFVAADPRYAALMDDVLMLLPITGMAMAGLVLSNIYASILRGMTNVRVPALIALGGYWGVGYAIMITTVTMFGMGATGVWVGLAAGTLATAVASGLYLAGSGRILQLSLPAERC